MFNNTKQQQLEKLNLLMEMDLPGTREQVWATLVQCNFREDVATELMLQGRFATVNPRNPPPSTPQQNQ